MKTTETNVAAQHAHLALPSLRDQSSSWDWQAIAQCQNTDLDFFKIDSPKNVAACKLVCTACVARAECLDFAVRNDLVDGIWGGTLPRERKKS